MKWYTFSQASRKIHRNRNYFSNRYRLTPKYFNAYDLKIIGGIKFINNNGISEVLKNIKKMVVHVNNGSICVD